MRARGVMMCTGAASASVCGAREVAHTLATPHGHIITSTLVSAVATPRSTAVATRRNTYQQTISQSRSAAVERETVQQHVVSPKTA